MKSPEALFLTERESSQVMKFITNNNSLSTDFPKDESSLHNNSYAGTSFPMGDAADIDNIYSGSSPYHVNYCGFEACQPGYQFGPHSRSSYLLHVVFSGKGVYLVGDKTYHVSAGQIFLISPRVVTTYRADTDDPWSYGWIGFSGHRANILLSQMGFTENELVITLDDVEPLRECILSMMNTHRLTYANELYRTAEMLRFFAYAIEHQTAKSTAAPSYSKSAYAQVAMRYLEYNYMNKIKISELADHIGIDRSYLSKSFCKEYHVSPQEYLIRLRIEKAEYLLANTTDSISHIASQVGYPDSLAFSRIFKQRHGISATEYRTIYADNGRKPNNLIDKEELL